MGAASASTTLTIQLLQRTAGDLPVPLRALRRKGALHPVMDAAGTPAVNQKLHHDNSGLALSAIYVATTGNDANPGTKASPNASIQKGAKITVATGGAGGIGGAGGGLASNGQAGVAAAVI